MQFIELPNDIIAFWIVCISLYYLLHTQRNKLKQNYSGQTQALKNKKMPGAEMLVGQYYPPAVYMLRQSS